MNNNNLTYAQAEEAMSTGKFVCLPEWGGFWFRMPEGIRAFTVPSKVAKAFIDETAFTDRGDWRLTDGAMDFGGALTVLKANFAVRLSTWSPDEYVFIRPADTLDRTVVGLIKSLPAMVKALLYRDFKSVSFSPYFCKANKNEIHNGWVPSTEELLSGDWHIATDVR